MTPESMPKKPGWFELTDGDAPSAQVTRVNKKLPAIAVVVAGAIIATGAFFSNASEPAANAEQNTVASAAAVNTTGSTSTESTMSAATVSTSSVSNPTGVTAHGSGVTDPTVGGMKAPSADEGDDDGDDYGDDYGDNHEGREHHERGEHEDRD